jgi:hypothetical protein
MGAHHLGGRVLIAIGHRLGDGPVLFGNEPIELGRIILHVSQ